MSSVLQFLTADEAAGVLHCNADTVRRLAGKGKLPARKIGRRWLFDADQLRACVRGEWLSIEERPAGQSGLDSKLAVSLFEKAPAREIHNPRKNSKPRFGLVTGAKPT